MHLLIADLSQVAEGYDKFLKMTEILPTDIIKLKVIEAYGERLLKQNSKSGAFDTHTLHCINDVMQKIKKCITVLETGELI